MFKFTVGEAQFISLCLEWFLYGKISVLCALNCTVTLAKEVQLFPGLGLYSGIFAIYLQCPKKESRSAMFIFYVLCLLYFLSTATVVGDLLGAILAIHVAVSNNSIHSLKNMFFLSVMQDALSLQFGIDMLKMYFRLSFVKAAVIGCCDLIAQFILVRINIIIHFIHLNLRRSTDVGSCGEKISMS